MSLCLNEWKHTLSNDIYTNYVDVKLVLINLKTYRCTFYECYFFSYRKSFNSFDAL